MESLKQIDQAIELEEYNLQALSRSKNKRILSLLMFAFFSPYFILLRILISLISLISSSLWKRCAIWYIRHYYTIFFFFRGTNQHPIHTFPTKFERPTLILSLRRDNLSPLISFLQFPSPIIIPLSKKMLRPSKIPFFPFSTKKLFSVISYPDANLNQNLNNIESLISAGYPTLVHINHHFIDPTTIRTIYFYQALEELLKKDIDIYFLNLENMSRHHFATLFTPTHISCNLITKEKLLQNINQQDQNQVLEKIAQFFGFTNHTVL
jgi:hypothetical protein